MTTSWENEAKRTLRWRTNWLMRQSTQNRPLESDRNCTGHWTTKTKSSKPNYHTNRFADFDGQDALGGGTVAGLVVGSDTELVCRVLGQSAYDATGVRYEFAVICRQPEERRFLAVLDDVAGYRSAAVVRRSGPRQLDRVLLDVLHRWSAGLSGFIWTYWNAQTFRGPRCSKSDADQCI